MTPQQKIFVREYVKEWDAIKAYRKAYPNAKSSEAIRVSSVRLLQKDTVKAYIAEIERHLDKEAGVSKLRIINEYVAIAFSNIADYYDEYGEPKPVHELTEQQQKAVAEIAGTGRIRLYSKEKALESLAQLLGYYDSPQNTNLTVSEQQKLKIEFVNAKIGEK